MEFHSIFFTVGMVIFGLCILTHIMPLFIKRASVFTYLGAVFHSALLVCLTLGGADISVVLLLYMASVAVYSAVRYVIARREDKDDV